MHFPRTPAGFHFHLMKKDTAASSRGGESWSPQDQQCLLEYIRNHVRSDWKSASRFLYAKTGKEFSADICKQKYEYYLMNESNNEGWSSEEEDRLFNLQKVLGNKWTTIAAKLGGK